MPQKPEAVLSDLKAKKYVPIYFLQGDEPYYIDLISNYIEENVLAEQEKGFNQMIMYGKEVEMNAILTNARRFPMMAERQVVIVKEAQEIQDLKREAGQALLQNYIDNPVPSTVLVFCHKYKSLDGRKALAKMLDKKATLVSTKKLYDNQIPAWIESYIKTKGYSVMPKGTQMLANYIGSNLERLSNEITKVLINYEAGATIDADAIQKYVGISKEYNVFELQNALSYRNVTKANFIVHYFASNPKSNPIIPIIALLFSFFSKILLIHNSADKSDRGVAQLLKINPFFVKEYMQAARIYSLPKVIDNIGYLKEADLRSKGVDFNASGDGQILKELVFKLMH